MTAPADAGVGAPVAAARRHVYPSRWRIGAPIDRVWQALADVESWPAWWRYARRVQTMRPGDAEGLGALRRIDWGSRLPYGIGLDVETTEIRRHRLIRAKAGGDLDGEGVWTFFDEGESTIAHYVWSVELDTAWMRATAPLLAGVFRWNHHGVMRAGAEGLARHLGVPLLR